MALLHTVNSPFYMYNFNQFNHRPDFQPFEGTSVGMVKEALSFLRFCETHAISLTDLYVYFQLRKIEMMKIS